MHHLFRDETTIISALFPCRSSRYIGPGFYLGTVRRSKLLRTYQLVSPQLAIYPAGRFITFSLRRRKHMRRAESVLLTVPSRCFPSSLEHQQCNTDAHLDKEYEHDECIFSNGIRENLWHPIYSEWQAIYGHWSEFLLASAYARMVQVGLMNYGTTDINKAFADIAATGATTVRTWGFNEVTTNPGVPFYQSWNGKTPTINTGSNGLQNFDNVVAAAKAHGLRLIVTLTNNWSDYGGMDVYVNQLLGQGQPHDFFYSNPTVIAAFQNYVRTFVSRYVNEPGILGWELVNEPRCTGSTSASSGTCTTTTISNWAAQLSAFIKGIDSNHLVAIGDEGFFNEPGNANFLYQGTLGIDFSANLNIKTIDFGTFHLYPDSWGQARNPFGQQWITDHATSMKASNKPVIMEEFGVTSDQTDIYSTWYSTVLSSGISGDLIWQAGSTLTNGPTPNDGYAVYPGDAVYALETSHAAALKARNGG